MVIKRFYLPVAFSDAKTNSLLKDLKKVRIYSHLADIWLTQGSHVYETLNIFVWFFVTISLAISPEFPKDFLSNIV